MTAPGDSETIPPNAHVTDRRTLSLDQVRADGWLERLRSGLADYDTLSRVLGERFVAFSFIAGVRVTGVTPDRASPDATLVDFVVGEEGAEQRMALGEFRRRLALALLADESKPGELPSLDPTTEEIQAHIGFRYVLLAPLFGVRLRELRVGPDALTTIMLDLGGAADEVTVEDFREVIRERIRAEVKRVRPSSPFSIDLAMIPEARTAADAGQHERVIELLGAWPGPLSLLLRTPEGHQLAIDVRAALAGALGTLGSAYLATSRYEWAEEVIRLGIQWANDGPIAADLFRRLGAAYIGRERYGEAIGVLRRASALGAPAREVLPLLARAYAARKRLVAAVVCAEEAVVHGADLVEMETLRREALVILGDAWLAFRSEVPIIEAGTPTIPAAPMRDTIPVPPPDTSVKFRRE